jgi:uncharacterized protein YutE (UPF0331/DUF86 family)
MIDRELVTRKILLIARDLQALREIGAQDLVRYLRSPTAEVLAERYLERMIGRMIDINYHLLTELGHPPPADYYASFLELGRVAVIAPELARRMAACAGLRNRLVHEYDAIDPEKVHGAIRSALGDVPEFLAQVRSWLERSGDAS